MNDKTLIKAGIIGALIPGVCCATPILVFALGSIGLSALTTYLDYVLVPIFALGVALLAYGLYRHRRTAAACCTADAGDKATTGT